VTILGLLVVLLILGLLFYLVRYIPDATGQTVARIIIVVIAIVWLAKSLGAENIRLW